MKNYNDPRAKWIEKLIDNKLNLDDTFAFKCKECGNCCHNREDIILSAYDIYRISKYLNLKPHEFYKKYCESYIGSTSNLVIVRLKPKPVPNILLRNPEPFANVCPLLTNGKCLVHKAKPVMCAMFPVGRIYNAHTKEVSYVINELTCGDTSVSYTVKEWLEAFNISGKDNIFLLWNEFITHSLEKFKQLRSIKQKELFWSVFLTYMYFDYVITDEFLPQLEKNIKKFNEFARLLIENK